MQLQTSHILFCLRIALVFSFISTGTTFGQQGNFGTAQQQNGIGGQTAPSSFGNQGAQQSGFGQAGQQRNGQFGQQGIGQNQRQVGGRDGFVGTDADQVRNQQNGGRQQRRSLFDFAIESLNELRDQRRERSNRRNEPSPVRVRVRPLFSVQASNPIEVTGRLQSSLQRAMPTSWSSTRVSVSGTSATVEGTVASEYERKLAAKMISLTPGIYAVNNQLTVEQLAIESPSAAPLLEPTTSN